VAIDHPTRVASLCSIMSTTGDRDVGRPSKAANKVLLAPPPKSRNDAMRLAAEANEVVGSPDHRDPERAARLAGEAFDRAFHPIATARQLLAVWSSGSRTDALRRLAVPALVIHGDADVLIEPDGGRRTAEAIPGAELLIVPGMGHDLAPAFWPTLIDALSGLVARAGAQTGSPAHGEHERQQA
jgi:pimeloyl-ACP methyl ester carboxylesterase